MYVAREKEYRSRKGRGALADSLRIPTSVRVTQKKEDLFAMGRLLACTNPTYAYVAQKKGCHSRKGRDEALADSLRSPTSLHVTRKKEYLSIVELYQIPSL